MSVESIGLILVVGFLLWQWHNSVKKSRPHEDLPRIQLVSKTTGEVLEMQVVGQSKPEHKELSDDDFLKIARVMFQHICSAFAGDKKKELKSLLTPNVYQTFTQVIDNRSEQKQKMEFTLICFSSVKIINKTANLGKITVEFITEQINLLKNEKGDVIEGDPLHIAQVADVWTFKKQGRSNWVVSATQQGVIHVNA